MLLVERHNITGNDEIIKLCTLSKQLYNKCNYLIRKAWFANNYLPDINILVNETQYEDCYLNFNNTKTAKQIIRKCISDWSTFKKTLNAWNKKQNFKKPKPPNYKQKLNQVIFYNETIRKKPLKNNIITPTNDLFKINSKITKFKQVIITPKTFGFIIDVQYEKEVTKKTKAKGICCIDLGINNLATVTSDQHKPILVNGRILKSINQYYNKYPTKHNSKKRYFRIENYFHHVSKLIINNCIKYNIGTIIIGRNTFWKQKSNLGKLNNQKFQCIPFHKLIQKIEYKAKMNNIEVILTEESYTSQSSFLDYDILPKYEVGKKYKFTGIRSKGMYNGSKPIHADVNGSLNIGRKVIGDKVYETFSNRSIAAMPERINPLKAFLL